MELVYVEVMLADGRVSAHSSGRGLLFSGVRAVDDIFEKGDISSGGISPARVMVHLKGDSSAVSDGERERLMESAKRVGFGVVRFDTGALMELSEAFDLMALPFT